MSAARGPASVPVTVVSVFLVVMLVLGVLAVPLAVAFG